MNKVSDGSDDSSIMRDIVDYEIEIGRLLADREKLAGKLAKADEEREAWRENQLDLFRSDLSALSTAVLRLTEGQTQQFENIYRLLSQVILADKAGRREIEGLNQSLASSDAIAAAINQMVSGKQVERIAEAGIKLKSGMSMNVVRGKAVFDKAMDASNSEAVILHENKDTGVHSFVFPLEKITATGLRGVALEVKPLDLRALRIRLQDEDGIENRAEVSVDLKNLRHSQVETTHGAGRRFVTLRRMEDGWIEVVLEASLGANDASTRCELIAIADVDKKSSQRAGTGKKAFALRKIAALKSDGLLPAEELQKVDTAVAKPAVALHEVRMPKQETARQKKREEFLASGAYHKLARLRNIHEGKRAFIIGNGPSINKQDLTLLKDEVTFVTNWFVNHPNYDEIDPTYYAVSSHEMFGGWSHVDPKPNPDWLSVMLAKAGNSHKFFSFAFREMLINNGIFSSEECDFLLFDRPKYQVDQIGGINLDLTQPMDDGYTGIVTFCLPLAHYMGIKEIYLVGCDCDYGITSPDSPKSYFYDYSQHKTRTTSHEGLMRAWADDGPVFKTYEIVRDRFALDGIRIVNATEGGRLEVFPRQKFEDVVGAK